MRKSYVYDDFDTSAGWERVRAGLEIFTAPALMTEIPDAAFDDPQREVAFFIR